MFYHSLFVYYCFFFRLLFFVIVIFVCCMSQRCILYWWFHWCQNRNQSRGTRWILEIPSIFTAVFLFVSVWCSCMSPGKHWLLQRGLLRANMWNLQWRVPCGHDWLRKYIWSDLYVVVFIDVHSLVFRVCGKYTSDASSYHYCIWAFDCCSYLCCTAI